MSYNPYTQMLYGQPMQPYNAPYQQGMQQPSMGQQVPSQSFQNAPQQAENANGSMVMVIGEADATARYVANGCSAAFFDINAPIIYIKTVAPNGTPLPLRVLDYTERGQQVQTAPTVAQPAPQPQIDLSEYVKRSEIEQIVMQYIPQKKAASKVKEVTENE